MFVVAEADADAIRAIFNQAGAVGCYRAAPAISWDHRQREGAGARPDHPRVIRLRPRGESGFDLTESYAASAALGIGTTARFNA
jgi:hypothetical protein